MSTVEGGDQLQDLREVIEGLDLPVHSSALAEARALHDRFTAALAKAEAEADYCATAGWQVDGFGSMAAFARHSYRVSDAEGRRIANRAERLAAWPEPLAAWLDGTLTGATVDAVVGLVPERHVERFASTAAENVGILAPLNLPDTREAVRHWVSAGDAAAERRADALVEIARFYNENHAKGTRNRRPPLPGPIPARSPPTRPDPQGPGAPLRDLRRVIYAI